MSLRCSIGNNSSPKSSSRPLHEKPAAGPDNHTSMERFLPIVMGFLLMLWALHSLEDEELQDSEGPDNHTDIGSDCFSLDWWV